MSVHDKISKTAEHVQLEIMKDYMIYLFYDISRTYFNADWHTDLEYHIWHAVMQEPNPAMITDDERLKLVFAAVYTNSWPIFSGVSQNPVSFVQMAEWGNLYVNWVKSHENSVGSLT